jgi:hypothetical protein
MEEPCWPKASSAQNGGPSPRSGVESWSRCSDGKGRLRTFFPSCDKAFVPLARLPSSFFHRWTKPGNH